TQSLEISETVTLSDKLELTYHYPSNQDLNLTFEETPEKLLAFVLDTIRQYPESEWKQMLLDLWEMAPVSKEQADTSEYIPLKKRKLGEVRGIPKTWVASRVTILGDAAHA